MALLQWNDDFETGIAAADHEHGKLVDLVNRIYDRWLHDGGKDRAGLIDRIAREFRAHFDFEDRIAGGADTAHYAAHAEDHERLLVDLRRIAARAAAPDYDLAGALAPCLADWLDHHIRDHDAPLYRALSAS